MTALCPTCRRVAGRSREEHNLLFAVIAQAFDNWPESHAFQPSDAEHLRAWLLIEAGHYEAMAATSSMSATDIAEMGRFFMGGRKEFRIVRRRGRLAVLRPATIRKSVLGPTKYREVSRAVYEIIEGVTGIIADEFARAGRAA
jgi:hypothetical protein